MSGIVAGEVAARLLDTYPAAWAEPWDRVGLVAGAPEWAVTRVLVTLDLDEESVSRAQVQGFDMIVTHHPPFLDDVGDLTPGSGGSGSAWKAVTSGIAVASFHTNLDRAPQGAEALTRALGMEPEAPLESGLQEMDLVAVYVPQEARAAVQEAMAGAGAGRIGQYEDCSFDVQGEGRFTPRPGAAPASGAVGEPTRVGETRVEMVCPPDLAARAVRAAVAAHPYEEPLVTVTSGTIARGAARLGRTASAWTDATVGSVAERVSERLGVAPRVWGEAATPVSTVACANGSATSLLDAALASGAQALVCGEVRYHGALEAAESGLAIIEAGHDATEWPLVSVLAEAVRVATEGQRVEVVEAASEPRWWSWGVT